MIHYIHLKEVPIFEQLQLEEALLRTSDKNWLIINEGSPPAIVMGISGKLEQMVHGDAPVPVIRRFSGGGTVVVDENTLFVSWILQQGALPIAPFPDPILQWTSAFYQNAWGLADFQRQENDYALGHRKCGGNAQYLKRDKWLHHTTFLWDFDPKKMQYLKYPPKTPTYRAGRSHLDFLAPLAPHRTKKELIDGILKEAKNHFPNIIPTQKPSVFPDHRKSVIFCTKCPHT